jgi:NADH-quinone oxidoreductase subunit I
MEQPPHPMRLGDDEKDYYLRVPGSSPVEPVSEERV